MALNAHLDPVQTQIEGRRQSRRSMRLKTSGTLPGGAPANVVVHNISGAGLLIETDLALNVGEALSLELPEVGPVGAQVVWQSAKLFGCAFDSALGEAALAAAELRGDAAASGLSAQRGRPALPASLDPFGVRLNRLRRERGLTLAQVAEALDVSKPTVWAWEKGKARPLPERIAAIAKTLDVTPEELRDNAAGRQGSELVEECRLRIATEYGTQPQHIRIMIEV